MTKKQSHTCPQLEAMAKAYTEDRKEMFAMCEEIEFERDEYQKGWDTLHALEEWDHNFRKLYSVTSFAIGILATLLVSFILQSI